MKILTKVYGVILHLMFITLFALTAFNTIETNKNTEILHTLWYNQTMEFQRELQRDQVRKQCVSIGVKI